MKENQNLRISISHTLPQHCTTWDEVEYYIKRIKGTPAPISTDIEWWQNNANTPTALQVKDLLNGNQVVVQNNILTIIAYKPLISTPDDVKKIVNKIFDDGLMEFQPIVNNKLKAKVSLVRESVRIISQIREPHFFKKKNPVKIRINFSTTIKLKSHVADVDERQLDQGVALKLETNFFPILKKILNEPKNLYIVRTAHKEWAWLHTSFLGKKDSSTLIFHSPKSEADLKKIFFHECHYRQPLNLEKIAQVSKIFASFSKTRIKKKVSIDFMPTSFSCGEEYQTGACHATICDSSQKKSLSNLYEQIQGIIGCVRQALAESSIFDMQEKYNARFISKETTLDISINAEPSKIHHYFMGRKNFFHQFSPTATACDPQKNRENLKECLQWLLENSYILEEFFTKEILPFCKGKLPTDSNSSNRLISDFIFSRLCLDPILYSDCGNDDYEKFSRMIMNIQEL